MNDSPGNPATPEAIEAIAADWLLERDDGFSPERAAAFECWLAADMRHFAAIERLEAGTRFLGKLPQVRRDPGLLRELQANARSHPARMLRFPWLRIMAAAAAIALAAAWWWPKSAEFQQTFGTSESEATTVRLPDDSRVELSAGSGIDVHYRATQRDVTLVRGQANFEVAKNAERPFVVTAGVVRVRAVGTAFHVRWASDAVEIAVTEGRVQVTKGDTQAPEDLGFLGAGQRLAVPFGEANRGALSLAPTPVAAPLAGELHEFKDTPLAQAIEVFNRVNKIKIILGDTELGALPVGGTFRLDNVEAFVEALKNSEDISAQWNPDSTVVLRKGK